MKPHRGPDIHHESRIRRACMNRARLRRKSVRELMFRDLKNDRDLVMRTQMHVAIQLRDSFPIAQVFVPLLT